MVASATSRSSVAIGAVVRDAARAAMIQLRFIINNVVLGVKIAR